MTGGCLLVAFAPDGATGNDDDDEILHYLLRLSTDPSIHSIKVRTIIVHSLNGFTDGLNRKSWGRVC